MGVRGEFSAANNMLTFGLSPKSLRRRCRSALKLSLNLVFNFAFTPLQFGLKSNILAAVDILFVLGTLIWAMVSILPYSGWIAYVQIPYLLWVSFATVLQLTITKLNLGK